jgi:hypothetical protein
MSLPSRLREGRPPTLPSRLREGLGVGLFPAPMQRLFPPLTPPASGRGNAQALGLRIVPE